MRIVEVVGLVYQLSSPVLQVLQVGHESLPPPRLLPFVFLVAGKVRDDPILYLQYLYMYTSGCESHVVTIEWKFIDGIGTLGKDL